jgi:hypothetical protein
MPKPNIAEAATKIVDLLTPFESDERHRAVQAALTLLGESSAGLRKADPTVDSIGDKTLPTRAQTWMRQSGLIREQLEHVFQIDDDVVELIAAAVPGKTDKERTLNVYVLTGVARLLATGDASFDDKTARQACKNLGCFNETNHSSYMKDKGNKIAGSKDTGWKLTAPGLVHGATLVKEVTASK